MNWLSDKAIGRLRAAAEEPELEGTGYRRMQRIARGGMGVVWLAEDEKLERRVALKVLDVPDASGALEQRLLREAKILARLEHPGIVPVHDVGRLADGRVFYTMKYVQGRRLDQHLAEVPALPDRLRIFARICEAAAFAHARGVLHRDLKPENIMVGPFGEVLVMDWGVAKVMREVEEAAATQADSAKSSSSAKNAGPQDGGGCGFTAAQTEHGAVLGTPGYMAPEQARGEVEQLDERADVYALGAILRFLLTGKAPEDATTMSVAPDQMRARAQSLKTPWRPPAGHRADFSRDVPKPLRAIVAKAMAHEPAARYAGATHLAADVARYLDGLPVSAYPEGLFGKIKRLYRKHQTAVLLVLTYVVVRALLIYFRGR